MAPLYFNSLQNTLVNWIIRSLLSLLPMLAQSDPIKRRTMYNKIKIEWNSVIANEYYGPKCPFTTQINPFTMNHGYNKRICPVASCLF